MVSNPRKRDEAIMFCRNANYQISMFDPLNRMPKYLIDILKNSWCHAFREYIFPKINEERFSVLYSDNPATRPNSPVNVIIGLLIIKEIFQDSDEELIGSLHFDIRYQYALHTTSLACELLSLCGGGCPGLIFDRYGTLQEVDPRCRRKNNATSDNC